MVRMNYHVFLFFYDLSYYSYHMKGLGVHCGNTILPTRVRNVRTPFIEKKITRHLNFITGIAAVFRR